MRWSATVVWVWFALVVAVVGYELWTNFNGSPRTPTLTDVTVKISPVVDHPSVLRLANRTLRFELSAGIPGAAETSPMTEPPEPDPQPITVSFKGEIRSDGALVAVTIRQNDQFIFLTQAQVDSLIRQIKERLARETKPRNIRSCLR